jgi:FtsH-binding integral membrane protein
VKQLAIYNLMRMGLLVATFAVVAAISLLVTGDVEVFPSLLIALILSAIVSARVLREQRDRVAEALVGRASAAVRAAEELEN